MEDQSQRIVGVVYQLYADGILFEFETEGDRVEIGLANPRDITFKGKRMPDEILKKGDVSTHVLVGDELHCQVVKRNNLPYFTIVMEDEDFVEGSKGSTKTRTMKIKPDWLAISAQLVRPDSQDEDVFDVNTVDKDSPKFDQPTKLIDLPKPFAVDSSRTSKEVVNKVVDQVVDRNREKVGNKSKHSENKDSSEAFFELAEIVQLRKPTNELDKVVECYVKFVTGKFKGNCVLVSNKVMSIFGNSLQNASLVHNILPSEPCSVRYHLKNGGTDSNDVVVETLSLGHKSTGDGFSKWLLEHGLTGSTFYYWISDKLPFEPFFPLKSQNYRGKVVAIFKDFAVVKVPVKDGERDANALLAGEDFCCFGVRVRHLDLRYLLRVGDELSCQIERMFECDRRQYKSFLKRCPEFTVTHLSCLGYVGPTRPEKVGQSHGESTEEVKAFLKQRGLTLDEFEEMKNLSTLSKSQTQLNEVPGGQSLPKVPEVPTISGVRGACKQEEEIAKNLAANLIRAKSSKGRRVTAVLKNQEDIDVAKYLMKKLRDCLEKKADKNTENVAMDFEVNHGDNDALTPHLTRDLTKKEGRMILEKKYGPLTPLDYLRLFTKENKYISLEGNNVWFDDIGFPKTIKTNFQISDGSNDFYTLETLCHFVRIKVAAGISHQAYARQAAVDGLIPVNNLDGIKLTDYLYGKTKKVPDNVKQISHKQLNPHLLNYDLTVSAVECIPEDSTTKSRFGQPNDPLSELAPLPIAYPDAGVNPFFSQPSFGDAYPSDVIQQSQQTPVEPYQRVKKRDEFEVDNQSQQPVNPFSDPTSVLSKHRYETPATSDVRDRSKLADAELKEDFHEAKRRRIDSVHEDRRPEASQFVAPKVTGFSSSFSQPDDSFFTLSTRQTSEDSGLSWNFSGPQNKGSTNYPEDRLRQISPDFRSRALSPEQSRQPLNQRRYSPDRQRGYSPDRFERSGREFTPDLDFEDGPMTSSEPRISSNPRRSLSPRRSSSRSRDFYPDERPSQRSSRSPPRTVSHNSGFRSSQSGPNPEEYNDASLSHFDFVCEKARVHEHEDAFRNEANLSKVLFRYWRTRYVCPSSFSEKKAFLDNVASEILRELYPVGSNVAIRPSLVGSKLAFSRPAENGNRGSECGIILIFSSRPEGEQVREDAIRKVQTRSEKWIGVKIAHPFNFATRVRIAILEAIGEKWFLSRKEEAAKQGMTVTRKDIIHINRCLPSPVLCTRLHPFAEEAVHSFVDACILFIKVLGFRFEPEELSEAYKLADVADAEFRGKLEEYFILLKD